MFVIPCRFDPAKPIVFECVMSIMRHMPNERIFVMDSCSEDQQYLATLVGLGCTIAKGNEHYEAGAYWFAYENFPDEDFFYLIHDSLLVLQDLTHYKSEDVTPLSVLKDWSNVIAAHKEWAEEVIKQSDYEYMTKGFAMLLGTMSFTKRSVLDKLYAKNFHKVLPTDKIGSQSMERLWGIALAQEGYPYEYLAERAIGNAPQLRGNNAPIRKIWLNRS